MEPPFPLPPPYAVRYVVVPVPKVVLPPTVPFEPVAVVPPVPPVPPDATKTGTVAGKSDAVIILYA
jgi:hypothetical protein